LDHLLNTRVYLYDRRRAIETVAASLENANNTYSHAPSLDELRTLNAAIKGIDAILPLLEDDIERAKTQMEVERHA
jgi:hypothetical protein